MTYHVIKGIGDWDLSASASVSTGGSGDDGYCVQAPCQPCHTGESRQGGYCKPNAVAYQAPAPAQSGSSTTQPWSSPTGTITGDESTKTADGRPAPTYNLCPTKLFPFVIPAKGTPPSEWVKRSAVINGVNKTCWAPPAAKPAITNLLVDGGKQTVWTGAMNKPQDPTPPEASAGVPTWAIMAAVGAVLAVGFFVYKSREELQMSYELSGAFQDGAVTQASRANVYNVSEILTRSRPPLTCGPGMVPDSLGVSCVSQSRCGPGKMFELKTGACLPVPVHNVPLPFIEATPPAPPPAPPVLIVEPPEVVDEKDNTPLFIGLGVAAALGATVLFFALKKKKAALWSSQT